MVEPTAGRWNCAPGEHGRELLLQPTGPVENWFWRQEHGELNVLAGVLGTRRDPDLRLVGEELLQLNTVRDTCISEYCAFPRRGP